MEKTFNFGKYSGIDSSIVAKYDPYYITWGLENLVNVRQDKCNFLKCKDVFMKTYDKDKTYDDICKDINNNFIGKCFETKRNILVEFLDIDENNIEVKVLLAKPFNIGQAVLELETVIKLISRIKNEITLNEFNEKIYKIWKEMRK